MLKAGQALVGEGPFFGKDDLKGLSGKTQERWIEFQIEEATGTLRQTGKISNVLPAGAVVIEVTYKYVILDQKDCDLQPWHEIN